MAPPSDQFMRMAVFYAALQLARVKGLPPGRALEVASDYALAPYERVLRAARHLVSSTFQP